MKVYVALAFGYLEDGCAEDNWDEIIYAGIDFQKACDRAKAYTDSIEAGVGLFGINIQEWKDGKLIKFTDENGEEI